MAHTKSGNHLLVPIHNSSALEPEKQRRHFEESLLYPDSESEWEPKLSITNLQICISFLVLL